MRNAATLLLIAILIAGAFLRLWNLDASEFKYDEARVCNLAAQFVDTGVPPVRGMGSSTGIDNPPLTIYIMSLPVLLSRDPLVVTAFVALINIVAIWGCFWLGRRYWGAGVGLLAALLLAVSPWATFYSRKVWAQNLLLPWVILFVAFLYAWFVDRVRWALAAAIVSCAAMTQIHFAALAFLPILGLLFLVELVHRFRHKQLAALWMPLLAGIGLGVLLYLPYLAFDALIGWKNVHTLIETMRGPAQTQWEAVRFALLNVGGREIHALAGPERFQEFLRSIVDLSYWPDRVQEALVLVSLVYLLLRCWIRRRDDRSLRRDGILLLWLVAVPLFFLRSKSPVYPHYLIPLYPAPYIALAIAAWDALNALHARSWRIGQGFSVLSALLLGALVVWQSYLSLSIHAFVDTHHTPGGMGTPIRILRQVVRTMERYADEWDDPQVVMLCRGDDPRWDECPAVYRFMTGRSLEVRFADYDTSLLFPHGDTDALIALAPDDDATGAESTATVELARYTAALVDQSIPLREAVDEYRFYRLPAGQPLDPVVQQEVDPVRLANGVSLLGYELLGELSAGETVRLTVHWRVDDLSPHPPAQGYSFANHLLAADGQRFAQADGPGYRTELWRKGDRLLSWFDIALPADLPPPPHRLRVGMYVFAPPDQFTTVHVVDARGQPIADAAEWALE